MIETARIRLSGSAVRGLSNFSAGEGIPEMEAQEDNAQGGGIAVYCFCSVAFITLSSALSL